MRVSAAAATLVVAAVLAAGCADPRVESPSPEQSTVIRGDAPSTEPIPTARVVPDPSSEPSTAQVPHQLREAFNAMAWTAEDQDTDATIVGIGAAAVARLDIGPAGSTGRGPTTVCWIDERGDQTAIGLVSAIGQSGPWPVDLDARGAICEPSPDGRTIYVQGMRGTRDGGVLAVDTVDGSTRVLLDGVADPKGRVRTALMVSPGGDALLTVLCDLNPDECVTWVIHRNGDVSRLPKGFLSVAISDRVVLGLDDGAVRLWDFASAGERLVKSSAWGTAEVVDGRRFLVRGHRERGDVLHLVTRSGVEKLALPADAVRLRLMRLPVLEGRWAPMGADSSLWTPDGSAPTIRWLDLETGGLTASIELNLEP